MTKKDMELMAEAYEQIEEGIFSRAKARVAGVRGSIGDAVERGKGQLQKAAGKTFTAIGAKGGEEFAKAGQARVDAGQGSGAEAKIKSITASIMKGVLDDLTKLGLDGNPKVVGEIQTALEGALEKLLEPPFKADTADADAPATPAYSWSADADEDTYEGY